MSLQTATRPQAVAEASPTSIIRWLAARGIALVADGCDLRVKSRGPLSADVRERLRVHKAALLAHLSPRHQDPSGKLPEGSTTGPPPSLTTTAAGVAHLAEALTEWTGKVVGLDTETTGLDPLTDRVRLIQIAAGEEVALIDVFALPDPRADLAPLFEALAGKEVVGHNLAFDLAFLARLGFTPGGVRDTMLASQVLDAGDRAARHRLKDVAARHLGLEVDKELQTADWSGRITPGMLRYAARDAQLPLRLWEKIAADAAAVGLSGVLADEMAALPCVAWASASGVGVDPAAWAELAAAAVAEVVRLGGEMDALIAPHPGGLPGMECSNWDSRAQVIGALARVGVAVEATGDDILAGVTHPLAALLRDYRSAAKLADAYGRKWLRHVARDGRVYATWKQIGAGASGRMSCKGPNLQQLPRDPRYRRCILAPPGRVLVKADYSQIELRIAAKITGDRRMLAAYLAGEDLHTLTARALLGWEDVAKADRQLAKAVNFGLLYGQGAKGLAASAASNFGLALTEAEATAHRTTFFRTYPGLRAWHRTVKDGTVETRTLAGRRRVGVSQYTEKLNTPVQGTGADGLKRALALLWERRAACPGAFPVLFAHDEIVVECDEAGQEEAADWVRACMVDGMAPLIDPVPVEVEVTTGRTWGG